MPITLSYAEQATGIVLDAHGRRELNAKVPYFEAARDMPEAVTRLGRYLARVPSSEAWINYLELSYRVTLPDCERFGAWAKRCSETGDTGAISIGMDVGAVISELGLPALVGSGPGRQGLGAVLRYSPGLVDFHFSNDGRLFLVFDDDPDNPRTMLG